ncbi:hypothetical protein JD844_010465 [Phrynosoma platyrhinos]|uniref:DNA-(apurinic or apyrimidinic site) endonuclease n=1 Tax=Phrynosoma platyrhinos TaxID=52577 RepID=A0ABQ7TH94_PHRPL|nr:hypothetical protein JD844_010465 [Phrynosoma platyrhinos]
MVCFERDLLEEPLAIVEGYNSYFSFCRTRSGYSGVATFCKASATPEAAEEGLTSEQQETTLTIINVYCPRADPEKPERADFKLRFYHLLQARAEALLRAGGHVVIMGDINTAHKSIDHCDPGDMESFHEHPGRRWLDSFLWEPGKDSPHGGLFVDTFRFLHPTQEDAYTCWCNVTGSRHLNYGTRIDYILADCSLVLSELKEAQLRPEVLGSDHCPVEVVLKSVCLGAPRCPPLCARFLPEFAGTQQKLSRFLVKVERNGLLEKGLKRGLVEPSAAMEVSKKSRTGLLRKGQGDLRSFFKVENSKGGNTHNAGFQSEMNVLQRAAEDSGKEPPTKTAEKTADECGMEHVDTVIQGPLRVLREESSVEVANEEIRNCEKDLIPSKPNQSAALWKSLLSGPARPPCCKAHGEPCVLRTVKKPGPNCGRRFYVCARPLGKPSDPRARCDFFHWASRGNT